MQSNFARALELVLAHEGGYSNHPKDQGGATNLGVTQRVYDAWRRNEGLGSRSVRDISLHEAGSIYRMAMRMAAPRIDTVQAAIGAKPGEVRGLATGRVSLARSILVRFFPARYPI